MKYKDRIGEIEGRRNRDTEKDGGRSWKKESRRGNHKKRQKRVREKVKK